MKSMINKKGKKLNSSEQKETHQGTFWEKMGSKS